MKFLQVEQEKTTALQYHRQIVPHWYLMKTTDMAGQRLLYSTDNLTEDSLKEYQLVTYLRHVRLDGNTKRELDKIKRLGIKSVLDIDDYWEVPKTHHLYAGFKANRVGPQTIEAIKNVDWVTTTTATFADIISKYNKNVTVLPNCISPLEPQFNPRPIGSHLVRIGWIGGVHHREDILQFQQPIREFLHAPELKDKFQLCLGGYNNNTDYNSAENIFTADYKLLDGDYISYLRERTPAIEHYSFEKPYRRLWAKPIEDYATIYNEIDVALVPLRVNTFTSCKSELKIVEAGHFSKAIICQNVLPYSPFLKHEVNCLSINKPVEWFPAMKRLIQEPQLRKDLGEGMNQTIREHFNIEKINKTRYDLYKRLCE